jgi:Ca2+-binding EF-hand superfamily protein
MKEAFIKIDSSGTGSIPTDDVCRIIKSLGHVKKTFKNVASLYLKMAG